MVIKVTLGTEVTVGWDGLLNRRQNLGWGLKLLNRQKKLGKTKTYIMPLDQDQKVVEKFIQLLTSGLV